jgi:tetrapyrrole methylase family protein/MazG family protein
MEANNTPLPGVEEKAVKEFIRLYGIIKKLRDPGGCPWDLEQTPESMRQNLLEEAYECVTAIDNRDDANLEEELGDIILVVLMIARMKEQERRFALEDAFRSISEKLVRRHPHVFGKAVVSGPEDVVSQWEDIKTHVEGKESLHSAIGNVPASLPPLDRALEMQKKAAKVGFDWKESAPIIEKLREEIEELEAAIANADDKEAEKEFGDILFTIVNIARSASINPSIALNRSNEKFKSRFMELEKRLDAMGCAPGQAGLDLMDSIWDTIKSEENRE